MANRRKTDDVVKLLPLLEELNTRLIVIPHKTQLQVAEEVDMPNSQVSRILSIKTNPTWMDMTRLLIGAGMQPNEAASMVGFDIPQRPSDEAVITEEEKQILDIMRAPNMTPAARATLVAVARTLNVSPLVTVSQMPVLEREQVAR